MKFVLVLLLSSSVSALNKDDFIPVFQSLVSGYLGANTGKVMVMLIPCLLGEDRH